MPLLSINCPACGESKRCEPLARSEYWPVAPQLIGGNLAALVFVLSRKRRFQCRQCGQEFFRHTIGSRLWLGVWIYFCLALALAVAVVFLSLR